MGRDGAMMLFLMFLFNYFNSGSWVGGKDAGVGCFFFFFWSLGGGSCQSRFCLVHVAGGFAKMVCLNFGIQT